MNENVNGVELLAPAGNLEKLKMAVIYGADAVYAGGEEYGLRAQADNFSLEELEQGIEFAHNHGKKIYVTLNIIAHNEDLKGMEGYIKKVASIGADAVIVSDPGVLMTVKEVCPEMSVHLSTQANTTNWKSALFWYKHGVKRIVPARELSLQEISEMRRNLPDDAEIEAFIHGAMCISYSGRCLLSSFMASRDANRGKCAHPCRWKYHLAEEKRPGEYMPVFENDRGTFIFNSKDLCMIRHIPELISAGISSFKIEGRMKSSYYVATVVKAYREAIDAYYKNPAEYTFNEEWYEEICKASHREFTTGFYFNKAGINDQIYNTSSYIRDYDFIGIVVSYDRKTGTALVEQRNRFRKGDEIEVVNPGQKYFKQRVHWLKDLEGCDIDAVPHPQMRFIMPFDKEVLPNAILRKKNKD